MLNKNAKSVWSEKEESAIDHLKFVLCCSPVLAFPNSEKDFTFFTDASGFGTQSHVAR